MSKKSSYIPVSPGKYKISGMLKTPKDFYRDGRMKAPQRIVKKKSDDILSLEFKISKGKKKIFNPNTKRWILDSKSSRDRISNLEKIKSKSKMTMKKSSQPVEPSSPLYPDGLTLDICSKYNRNLELNLDQIIIAPPTSENISKLKIDYGRLKPVDRNIPGLLSYKGILLNNIEYISKGSYGTVWKYSSEFKLKPGWTEMKSRSTGEIYYIKDGKSQWEIPIDTNHKFYQVAVKTYKYSDDEEIGLVNELNKNGKRGTCNLINSKIMKLLYKNQTTIVSLMDLMDGTLMNLINIPLEDKLKVIRRASKHLECIKNITRSSAYTDLKAANILYKCFKNNKMKIVIGDIGGLCTHPSQRGAATFPAPEAIRGPNCSEGVMVWDLGVTFLEMINYDVMKLFYWNAANNYNETEFGFACDEAIQELIIKNNYNEYIISNGITLGYLLESMFESNPSKRITLKQIEEIFNGTYIKPVIEESDSESDSDDGTDYEEWIEEDTNIYDANGYDANGYDKDGYDINGYDHNGFDVDGYDANGYDVDGYDVDGYDANGYDVDGNEVDGF